MGHSKHSIGGRAGSQGALLALAGALLGACGGAPAAPDEGQVHAAFGEIQVQEARIETGMAQLQRDGQPCPGRCDTRNHVCDASAALCRIAQELTDPDARQRCTQATASCQTAEGVVGCDCPPPSE